MAAGDAGAGMRFLRRGRRWLARRSDCEWQKYEFSFNVIGFNVSRGLSVKILVPVRYCFYANVSSVY